MYLQDQKISAVTLRFLDGKLEREFFEDYFERTLRFVRFAIVSATVLYALFAILDISAIPESKEAAWIIRFGIFIPFSIFVLFLTTLRNYRQFMHFIMLGHAVVAGFGIIAMIVLAGPPGSYVHYSGLMLIILYMYTMIKLRFIYATIASWTFVVVYLLAAVFLNRAPFSILINNAFFLVSANLLGMIACYQIELYIRSDFLQRRRIRELEQKRHILEKEKILKDLHDGVGGIATSIALMAETAQSEASLREVRKALGSIFELSRESLTEIRGFTQSLDVKEMDWDSFSADLRHLGNNLLESVGIRFWLTSTCSDPSGRPDTLLYLNLFRIYKEALVNVIKHAQAKTVNVTLDVGPDRLQLLIEDDGIGIRKDRTGGRGLPSMQERARELGGEFAVLSERGTRIVVTIPLPAKYLPSGMEITQPA